MTQSNALPQRRFIQVCQYRSCRRVNSAAVLAKLKEYAGPELMVSASGCLGQCGSGPMVRVMPDDVWYCRFRPKDVPRLVEQHLGQNRPLRDRLHSRFHPDYGRLLERLAQQQSSELDE